MHSASVKYRFNIRVNKDGPIHPILKTRCWLWTGHIRDPKAKLHYGGLRIGNKMERAHRVSYELHVGEIPKDKCVMHECDNPICVNPEHLSIGTKLDNYDDMRNKGRDNKATGLNHGRKTKPERTARGEKHGVAKVTDDIVREMRVLREAGWTLWSIAKKFDVCERTVVLITKRITWRHVQ